MIKHGSDEIIIKVLTDKEKETLLNKKTSQSWSQNNSEELDTTQKPITGGHNSSES